MDNIRAEGASKRRSFCFGDILREVIGLGDEVIREAERDFEKQLNAISAFTGISKKRILQILISESTMTLIVNRNSGMTESMAIGSL